MTASETTDAGNILLYPNPNSGEMIIKLMEDEDHENPSEVANSELFKIRMREFSPMMFRIFSTEEAAYAWLKE